CVLLRTVRVARLFALRLQSAQGLLVVAWQFGFGTIPGKAARYELSWWIGLTCWPRVVFELFV
ncbi:MAG: hypothetical protein AB7U99_00650, partial [Steroidobacteraceae bacterium]